MAELADHDHGRDRDCARAVGFVEQPVFKLEHFEELMMLKGDFLVIRCSGQIDVRFDCSGLPGHWQSC